MQMLKFAMLLVRLDKVDDLTDILTAFLQHSLKTGEWARKVHLDNILLKNPPAWFVVK